MFCYLYFESFLINNGFLGSREVFKKLPGGGGFVLTKYEVVASHGDPIHGRNCRPFNLFGASARTLVNVHQK